MCKVANYGLIIITQRLWFWGSQISFYAFLTSHQSTQLTKPINYHIQLVMLSSCPKQKLHKVCKYASPWPYREIYLGDGNKVACWQYHPFKMSLLLQLKLNLSMQILHRIVISIVVLPLLHCCNALVFYPQVVLY